MTTLLLNVTHNFALILGIVAIVAIGIYAVCAAYYAFSFTSKKA
jgi:hypothetical protein